MLCLYGYSNQQPDGLSFPDDVMDPDVGRVAAVTLEVMSLRIELEMLIKVCVCVCVCEFYPNLCVFWGGLKALMLFFFSTGGSSPP